MSWRAECRITSPASAVPQAPSVVSWPCRYVHTRSRPTISWRTRRLVVACLATRPVAKPLPSCHDTTVCIVTCLANLTARLSQYKDCIVTQPSVARPSLLSQYKTLYRETHPQPGPACALPHALTHNRSCRGLSWLCRKASWPCRGHLAARPNHAWHDSNHCIMTQS